EAKTARIFRNDARSHEDIDQSKASDPQTKRETTPLLAVSPVSHLKPNHQSAETISITCSCGSVSGMISRALAGICSTVACWAPANLLTRTTSPSGNSKASWWTLGWSLLTCRNLATLCRRRL